MLGDRNLKDIIQRTMDDIYEGVDSPIDKGNDRKINVVEAVTCLRKSYYDRKNAILPTEEQKVSAIVRDAVQKVTKNRVAAEYSIDSDLLLVGRADSIVDDTVIKFEIVDEIPKVPNPQDLLSINAGVYIFDKYDGVIVYLTKDGESFQFSVTKNKKMFEETVRRARVLSTLLNDNKVPILEPSEECLTCPYYERCYVQEKRYSNPTLDKLLGFRRSTE